jgi:hypothetical protein
MPWRRRWSHHPPRGREREGEREGDSYWAAVRPRCVACGSVLERGMRKGLGDLEYRGVRMLRRPGGERGGLGEKEYRQ